ncbi:hypothetical protein VRRI112168_02795 [Vreelandella rituensis]|uniref:Uncharacterized protein n=1 Tax=Vreelandella rituensis TaxID=2282306 RepID=A0A368U9S8_9GAMM|nr:hypothetical protein [Halomonas rituensis]RCV93671.1 hypothetical protein DU506_00510 [Halomonas rituensis]
MDAAYVEASYKIEQALLDAYLNGEGTLREREQKVRETHETPVLPNVPLPGMVIPASFAQVQFSGRTYEWINCVGGAHSQQVKDVPVTDAMIREAKDFVGELLGEDVQAIRVVRVAPEVWGDRAAEGFLREAGNELPVVFVPTVFTCPVELLCHELAHAAHTMVRRRTGDAAMALARPASAEFIAHFVQYRYVMAYLQEQDLALAMGQLTTAMYAKAIQAFMLSQKITTGEELWDKRVALLESGPARPFLEALPDSVLLRQLRVFAEGRQGLEAESERALGIMLALLFIDDPKGVRAYMAIDTLARSIEDKVAEAFSANLDELLPAVEDRLERLVIELREAALVE